MKYCLLFLLLFPASLMAADTLGMQGLNGLKQCIMQNDTKLCHHGMTVNSYPLFDKFTNYKLMPCLPTDFTYESERSVGTKTIVTSRMPEDNRNDYIFHLVFVKTDGTPKLDIPDTLHFGLGENWQDKVNLSEQLFLMMKQNMQDKLTCDVLRNVVMPKKD